MVRHSFAGVGAGLVRKSTIVEIITMLLIVLFIYTGLSKMMDHTNFKYQLNRSPFIQPISNFIATVLPAGELLIASVLLFKRTRLAGLYASFFLMVLFTGYIFMMLHFSYDLPCSCGGVLAKMSWHDHLLFNSLFTLLAMVAVILENDINVKSRRVFTMH
ncbi:MAG: hypothetical protein P4L51_24660 [Puia sp.]|nr:hypothetical protein [Puia sp.]